MSETALTIATIDGRDLVPADRPTIIDPATNFLPVPWPMIMAAAELISTCPGLAEPFKDKDNCRFVAYQAARWGMDPIAVATKTYFSPRKGGGLVVGYEAQLVHALVESDPDLREPLDFQFGYSPADKTQAQFRFCMCAGRLRAADGTEVVRRVTSPTVGQIKVKNSPLWFSDVDQQLAYYTARTWARRYRPHRLLGVYSREEMEALAPPDPATRRALFEEDEAPDLPPETGDNEPAGLTEAREWAMKEQARLMALDFPPDIEAGWKAMADHDLGKFLVAHEPATMNKIKAALKAKRDGKAVG